MRGFGRNIFTSYKDVEKALKKGGLTMEKGFILVDVPEACIDCRFCREISEGIEAYCELEDDLENNELVREIDVSYPQEKPNWCPIREFPERKEPLEFPFPPGSPFANVGYEKGWNDCLDYLEGKDGYL